MKSIWIFLCMVVASLDGGVYLEKPPGFNAKAPTIGCCYLHYKDKILLIHVPNFDFEYHMVDYPLEIENPGAVKINFAEHKGFTWVTPRDALDMNLITDEDICFEMTFGLDRDK